MNDSDADFVFCFDLNLVTFNDKLKFYLPTAYIEKNAPKIDYLDKRATPDVLKSLDISVENLDKQTQRILAICENLKTDWLFKKYSKNVKKAKAMLDLLEDKKIEFGVKSFVTSSLSEFYTIVCQKNFPISIEMGSDKAFAKNRLKNNLTQLDTKLFFKKHSDGISYTLKLSDAKKIFTPSEHNIKLLLDTPAWISLDKELFFIKNIDAKKINPFLTKQTVEIPSKNVQQYFSTFIKEIAKKTEIQAEGFDAQVKNTVIAANLQPVHDFLKDKYFINIMFNYDGYVFDNSRTIQSISKIDDNDFDNIQVVQYKRNPEQELVFEKKLLDLGFEKTGTGFYDISKTAGNVFENVQWVIDNQKQLSKQGFSTDGFNIDGKKILIKVASISASSKLNLDWFDVDMLIKVGNFTINFTDIVPNIKSRTPLYELPDGGYFLIPEEWFALYEPLIRHSKIENNGLHLSKSKYALLEDVPTLQVHSILKRSNYKGSPLVKAELRPYQLDGVNWLLDHFHNALGACLADDMGLGKTIQTLSLLVAVQEELAQISSEDYKSKKDGVETATIKEPLKALIILPSSLVFNWYNEATKFTPHFSLLRYVGNKRKLLQDDVPKTDLIFTTYNFLRMDITFLEKIEFNYLILDESQYIKNKDSLIFKAISKIKAENKLSLSGTPIENSLDDLWSQMQFINPDILGTHKFFTEIFKKPIEKDKDEASLDELKKIIAPFILRRTKEQVLDDLPSMAEQILYCDMEPEQEKLYETEKSKARNSLLDAADDKDFKLKVINTLMRLRQLSNHPKIIDAESQIDSGKYFAVTNYLDTIIKEKKKTIIFSSFVSNLAFYKEWCEENNISYCEIIGATPPKKREEEVARFQNEEEPLLFFISLKAGGVGLNLTKASYVLFLDPWWNPFAESQGIGRAHRIGQLNKVNVVRFITKNTVEEKIIKLQENKRLLSDSLLSEDNLGNEVVENIDYLLE